MALLATLITISLSLFFTPFLVFFFGLVFLASIGKSLGVRRIYVKLLLKIFEYGRQHIEIAERNKSRENSEDEASEDEGGGKRKKIVERRKSASLNSDGGNAGHSQQKIKNGILQNNNGVSVISREDLILVPDPEQNYQALDKDENGLLKPIERFPRSRSYETLKREFELADCLDYIKTGVESIIEDQVTHRFEAEELKSWNLLTRTNRHYEFISWRLTVIWIVGFFFRHFFLFPLRFLICFCGVVWMTYSAAFVGLLPAGWFKRWLNARIYKISFRMLARSLSLVLTIHNREYMPNGAGVCVANHTTPIDVVLLSTENVFSMVMFMTVSMALVGYLPEGDFKRWILLKVNFISFALLCSSVSAVINYYNPENRPQCGICVANHTTPIDALVLAYDNHYSLIGQTHGGFLGFLQRAIARASPHIWFERSEVKDREAVARRLREHVSDPNNPPILIFPEGTCINNTSVMQFKKGGFEVGGVIYPVAIKYDPNFGDAYWNSSRYSMLQYLYLMMTSWAIVCDVWYLPPMYKQENESSIDFANRVKSVIARQGGLVDLMWDGQLKRMKAKPEWKEKQQEVFSKRLKVD